MEISEVEEILEAEVTSTITDDLYNASFARTWDT
jgi:hypothetical protein